MAAKRPGRWHVLCLIGLALLLPARLPAQEAAAAPVAEPRPAIWLLSDDDTKIYLFGTTHILPQGFKWRSPAVDRIVAEADELVMETADDDAVVADPIGTLGGMFLTEPVPILERVGEDKREALKAAIEGSPLPMAAYDRMRSWAAAFMLAAHRIEAEYAKAAEDAKSGRKDLSNKAGEAEAEALTGVETELQAEFEAAGKPISGVETSAQQIGFFQELSEEAQRDLLESTLDDLAADFGSIAVDDQVWVSGDVETLGRMIEESMPPELVEILLVKRNRAWTEWLVERLEKPGTILFAVGAGHLVGRASVQSMLESRGYQVPRID